MHYTSEYPANRFIPYLIRLREFPRHAPDLNTSTHFQKPRTNNLRNLDNRPPRTNALISVLTSPVEIISRKTAAAASSGRPDNAVVASLHTLTSLFRRRTVDIADGTSSVYKRRRRCNLGNASFRPHPR